MLRRPSHTLTLADTYVALGAPSQPAYAAFVRPPQEVIAAARQVLAEDPHVRWAYVFGSVARGTGYRDLDVALMPGPGMPSGGVAWGERIARLEAAAGCKVDLVDLSCADLPLLGPMLLDRVVVVDREPSARHSFEAETTSRWLDFKPSYEEFLRVRTLAAQRRMQGIR